MQFKTYTDVHKFHKAAYDVLMLHEAQNLIPLGNMLIGCEGTDKTAWRDPANWFMATVSDDSGVLLTAIMTPPHNLTIYATDNKINAATVNCLIKGLDNIKIPGVMAEKEQAEYFAKLYTAAKGLNYEVDMDQRIYELTEVDPKVPQFGTLRLLEEKDMHFFPYWAEAFYAYVDKNETSMPLPLDGEVYRHRIATKKIYILEVDGTPVSMAGITREMQTVGGVAHVYTPPYFRGRGYASSCVAQLSQLILDKGFDKCVLYTDLANPTSNSIYMKMGYKAICDSLLLKFV